MGPFALTATGAVVVAGSTGGSLGEANAGRSDAFVARFDRRGRLRWLTQAGAVTAPLIPGLNGQPAGPGGDASLWESVGDIAVDDDGSVLITGRTRTSLGETDVGFGSDLFVHRNGRLGIAGSTTGDLGEPNGGFSDVLVARLRSNGTLED